MLDRETSSSVIDWEATACPLCWERPAETVVAQVHRPTGQRCELRRCLCCGMGYTTPRPRIDQLGLLYPEDYEDHQPPRAKPETWRRRLSRKLERLILRHRFGYPPTKLGWLERMAATLAAPWFGPDPDALMAIPFCGEGRLLDYGCGAGYFAARMHARGWQAAGMDLSPRAVEQARRQFGITAHVGTLPHPSYPPESLDTITMGQVLEHVPEPHRLVRAAAEALRPGGMLHISVPNLAAWGLRAFGPYWWPLQLPVHLLFFTPTTLGQLLAAHGLEVVEVRMLRMTNWMQRSWANGEQDRWREWPRPLSPWWGGRRLTHQYLARWAARREQGDGFILSARKPGALPTALARARAA